MYYVYVIYNDEAKKFYIGQTKDLEDRLRLHNEHLFKGYTSRFDGSWILVYKEEYGTRDEVLIREKQLKSFRGREFVRTKIPG